MMIELMKDHYILTFILFIVTMLVMGGSVANICKTIIAIRMTRDKKVKE